MSGGLPPKVQQAQKSCSYWNNHLEATVSPSLTDPSLLFTHRLQSIWNTTELHSCIQ